MTLKTGVFFSYTFPRSLTDEKCCFFWNEPVFSVFQARTSCAAWRCARFGAGTGPSRSTSSTSTTPPGRRPTMRRRTSTPLVSWDHVVNMVDYWVALGLTLPASLRFMTTFLSKMQFFQEPIFHYFFPKQYSYFCLQQMGLLGSSNSLMLRRDSSPR